MRSTASSLLLLLPFAQSASETQPHYHRGVLKQYQLGPPEILLSAQDERLLRSGKAVTQALATDETRRMVMVQDIAAPSQVVMSRIMDFEKYDQMVSGVDACTNYCSYEETAKKSLMGAFEQAATKTIKSTYEIHALHLKFKYFVKHTYDPAQQCMVFCLDYDRQSDLDDSVGYWYVEPTARGTCRVFYSCECKLRGWVPGPVLNLLQKEALKKATTWVNAESLKEWHAQRTYGSNPALVRFVDNVRDSMTRKMQNFVQANTRDNRAVVHFMSNVRNSKARNSKAASSSYAFSQ